MKKTSCFFRVLFFLIFASLLNNPVNAQTGEVSLAIGEPVDTTLALSDEVDSSFSADLFTTWFSGGYSGNRASVSALARQNDGKILLAGNFHYVNGIAESFFVRLNADGTVDTEFNPPGVSPIQKIFPLAGGKMLIGGNFANSINGFVYRGLLKLNEDGSIDTDFAVEADSVSSFAVQPDGKIIIVGSFRQVNGLTINNVARLNPDGSLDTSFQVGSGTDSTVNSVAVQPDGKVLIGGFFNKFNNNSKPRLARLNTDGSLDTSFNTGTGPDNNVSDIILQADNKILISGFFNSFNGVARTAGVARLEADGTLDNSFAPVNPLNNTSGARIALQPDGKILVGIATTLSINSTSSTVYRFNPDGTLDSSFSGLVNGPVSAFILEDSGEIILGGAFTQINGASKTGLARLESNGATDAGFNYILSFAAAATAIAVQPNGKILVAGNFEYVNQTPKNGFARLNSDGSIDTSFNVSGSFASGSSSTIMTFAPLADGKILIGGSFTNFNGQNVNRIARLNSDGTLDPEFNVGGTGPNGWVAKILTQPDGKILMFGSFYSFNGAPHQGIMRLEKNGSVDTSFQPPFAAFASISTMTLQPDGKILLSGNFTLTGGLQRRGIIRLNSNGSLDENFNTLGEDAAFRAIAAQPDGKVLVGGSFYSVNGVGRRNVARLNADGSVDTTFSPRSGTNGAVNAILLETDGKIWIGGDFTTFDGVRRDRLARLNPDGSLDDFNVSPGANSTVSVLARQNDGRLLVGGSFSRFGRSQHVGLARVRGQRSGFTPLFDFDGDGKTDLSVFRANGGAWYRTDSSNEKFKSFLFGLPTDRLVPGDFDGDRKTDIAVWRPSSGQWFILKSTTGEVLYPQFGTSGDIPMAADYDGDGKDDLAVFRPSEGTWYMLRSRDGFQAVQFGVSTDVPLIGDFDGDGRADISVFRPSGGIWYILPSSGGFSAVAFGINEDIPVPGDYDGDGKTDFAVFRPSNGIWYLLGTTQGFSAVQFGITTDRPVPGDYDGDGRTDIAVFRPSSAEWFLILSSGSGTPQRRVFGSDGDLPVPAAFLR